jgi:hypothetical protein
MSWKFSDRVTPAIPATPAKVPPIPPLKKDVPKSTFSVAQIAALVGRSTKEVYYNLKLKTIPHTKTRGMGRTGQNYVITAETVQKLVKGEIKLVPQPMPEHWKRSRQKDWRHLFPDAPSDAHVKYDELRGKYEELLGKYNGLLATVDQHKAVLDRLLVELGVDQNNYIITGRRRRSVSEASVWKPAVAPPSAPTVPAAPPPAPPVGEPPVNGNGQH